MDVRAVRREEIGDYMAVVWRNFGGRWPTAEQVEKRTDGLLLDRPLAVFEDGRVVATAGAMRFEMTVPGGATVPTAGVTRVTVLPTERRRGLLTAMMRAQLDEFRAGGEPLAALFASEGVIYRRFGYGVAAYEAQVEIERQRRAFSRPPDAGGRVVLATADQALEPILGVWERARPAQPGMMGMGRHPWAHLLADTDPPSGQSPLYHAIYEGDQGPEGFALYRLKLDWREDGQPDGTLSLELLVTTTGSAYGSLWRHCLEADLVARVKAERRPLLEPLRFLLADARAMHSRYFDNVWLRLVDVEKALASRRYSTPGFLVLEVRDAFCPWNQGRYRIQAGEGVTCERTRARADLALDAAELAACYLGGNRFTTLRDAGLVDELRPGGASRADLFFAAERDPLCPHFF